MLENLRIYDAESSEEVAEEKKVSAPAAGVQNSSGGWRDIINLLTKCVRTLKRIHHRDDE